MKTNTGNWQLFLIPFLLGNYGCFSVRDSGHFTYSKIAPSEYDSLLKSTGNYYLVDVRTKSEYNRKHINGADNYSYPGFHFRSQIKNLDHSKTVFIYCQTCHRSPLAARKLKRMGFVKVYDLRGGYRQWKLEN